MRCVRDILLQQRGNRCDGGAGCCTARAHVNGGADARQAVAAVATEKMYDELIAQRPALLDEKVKIHERIIDEFNLASLEKLPRSELVGVFAAL